MFARMARIALVLAGVLAVPAWAGTMGICCRQAAKYNYENWTLNYACYIEQMFSLGW